MVHYMFNNGKPWEQENIRLLIAVHYCENCNAELVGEWGLFPFCDTDTFEWMLKGRKELDEVLSFSQLDECPICGEKFKHRKEHHFINVSMIEETRQDETPCFGEDKLVEYYADYTEIAGVNHVPPMKEFRYTSFSNVSEADLKSGDKIKTEKGVGTVRMLYEDTFTVDFYVNNTKSVLSFLREWRSEFRDAVVENKMTTLIDECDVESESVPTNDIRLKESFNVKGYLEQLLLIEKNIFSVSKRLRELYFLYYEAEKEAVASEKMMLLERKNAVAKAYDKYESLKAQNAEKDIKITDFPITYPAKPKEPQEPQKPILTTPGLFNKKRVLAENASLTEKYEADLEKYNLANEKYKEDLAKREETIAKLEAQRENEYQQAIKNAKAFLQEKIAEAKAEYEALLAEQTEAEKSAKDTLTPEKIKCCLLSDEIKTAEELLKNFYKARNQLYSLGVIFEKYRDIVAVSSFLEYISSGRCEALEGSNGAYNLFENEIRTNMVISQLNKVIESLEEIKQNQYMIYSAINQSNKQLTKLSSSMDAALDMLTSIKGDMSKVAENTELIAYNTEKTAFYAKKNAELTNALGFMVALK